MPHVPTVDIRRLGDIRFDTQLEKALAPSPDYDVQQSDKSQRSTTVRSACVSLFAETPGK